MTETVRVLQLGENEYAAEVHEAGQTTEHRVTFARGVLDELTPPAPAEDQLVVEAVKYLLQKTPGTALPHDIDLEEVQSRDADFVPELRARLAG